jgi:hypothetical protein
MDTLSSPEIIIYRRVRKPGLLFRTGDPALFAAIVAHIQSAVPSCVVSSDWVGGLRLPCIQGLGRRQSELYQELRRWLGREGWEPVYDDMLDEKPRGAGGYYACRLLRPSASDSHFIEQGTPVRPPSLVEQRRRLAAQHNAGVLDDTQYAAAKRKLRGT